MTSELLSFIRSTTSAIASDAGTRLLTISSWIVFAGLDVIDQLLCPIFNFLDFVLDSEKTACYCHSNEIQQGNPKATLNKSGASIGGVCPLESWTRCSDTVYASVRQSVRTRFHLLTLHRALSSEVNLHQSITSTEIVARKLNEAGKTGESILEVQDGSQLGILLPTSTSHLSNLTDLEEQSLKGVIPRRRKVKRVTRWSDCGCQRCTSWQLEDSRLLHVHVDDKDFVASSLKGRSPANSAENNVIFLHGFLSSSSFWAETVLPALPESVRSSHRLFAVDMLGFGNSPKPSDSLYTIADHIDMIRKSVIERYGIQSFHLVAHSMGCTVALSLGAHYSTAVKSITLIAPPYFPSIPSNASSTYIMQQVAGRRIWPLITFGSSVMSWYEHVGRVVCFVVCKHHRLWAPLLFYLHSKLPGNKVPSSCLADLWQHTHHSAWHIFHNTICVGALAADHCIEVLEKAGARVRVIHGTADDVLPFKNSVGLSERHPNVRLTAVQSASHASVVFGREAELAEELAEEILLKPL